MILQERILQSNVAQIQSSDHTPPTRLSFLQTQHVLAPTQDPLRPTLITSPLI
jgi:hypothetical protein